MTASDMLKERISSGVVSLHPEDAGKLGANAGDRVVLKFAERELECGLELNPDQPSGVALVVRSMGAMLAAPAEVAVVVKTAAKDS